MEKWFVFDGATTNLLKNAVFEINDLRCGEGNFRRNWVRFAHIFDFAHCVRI